MSSRNSTGGSRSCGQRRLRSQLACRRRAQRFFNSEIPFFRRRRSSRFVCDLSFLFVFWVHCSFYYVDPLSMHESISLVLAQDLQGLTLTLQGLTLQRKETAVNREGEGVIQMRIVCGSTMSCTRHQCVTLFIRQSQFSVVYNHLPPSLSPLSQPRCVKRSYHLVRGTPRWSRRRRGAWWRDWELVSAWTRPSTASCPYTETSWLRTMPTVSPPPHSQWTTTVKRTHACLQWIRAMVQSYKHNI